MRAGEREAPSFARFAACVLASVALFALLEPLLTGLGRLPPAAYERSFIAPAIVARAIGLVASRVHPAIAAAIAVAVLLVLAAALRGRNDTVRRAARAIAGGWRDIEHGAALRMLVGVVSGTLTWVLAAYRYNAYFEQSHVADRLLLVALWMLLLWRPVFAVPFVVVASAIAHQFQVPLASYSWTETELLVRIPVMLGAFWIVRAVAGVDRADEFIFLLCCLIAVTWWSSGFGKVRMGWITHPQVHLLVIGAHANGWLGADAHDTAMRLARVVHAIRIPLMLATLVVECGALLLLARRWTLVGFLCLTMTFHLVAFALTGILFWKWMIIDASLLAFLLGRRRIDALRIFSPAHLALAVAIILGHRAWIAAGNLSWFDTPLTYAIRLEGVDASGDVHVLPAGFFAPYTETFVLETFPYLSPHGQLTGPMGVTQRRDIARALAATRTADSVLTLERRHARARFDPERSRRFDRFVATWVATLNRRADGAPRAPSPPRHLWTFPLDAAWAGEPDITTVRVIEITYFFDGERLRTIRRRPLRRIDVAAATGHCDACPAGEATGASPAR